MLPPPITTVAKGLCTSAPIPVEIAIGKKPIAPVFAVADQKEGDAFVAEDAVFKTEDFKGKIAIKIDGKTYQVELGHEDHDHDHEKGHDDKNHDHD